MEGCSEERVTGQRSAASVGARFHSDVKKEEERE